MIFNLDIVIQKCEIEKLGLREQLIEWGGESFSQEPMKYVSSTNFTFEQVVDLSYYSKLLGIDLNEKSYIALTLSGEELFDLEFAINSKKEKLTDNLLLSFFTKLVKLNEFYLFLIREDENIKSRYFVQTEKELRAILYESLTWSTQTDVLVLKGALI